MDIYFSGDDRTAIVTETIRIGWTRRELSVYVKAYGTGDGFITYSNIVFVGYRGWKYFGITFRQNKIELEGILHQNYRSDFSGRIAEFPLWRPFFLLAKFCFFRIFPKNVGFFRGKKLPQKTRGYRGKTQ